MIYRKAFSGFPPALLRGFSAASSAGSRRDSSFEGVEGAAQSFAFCPDCGSGLIVYLTGYDFCGLCGCRFNFWTQPTAPAQPVRY